MYYRYEIVGDNIYKLSGKKSEIPLEGDNVVTCEEDFDLVLYDVIIGHIHNGVIMRHTKKLKAAEMIARIFTEIDHRQSELELETDFRLSMIELGLA